MSETTDFPGRVGIQQRVVPEYRRPFFDLLARSCAGGLSVFAGRPLPSEATPVAQELGAADLFPARNVHLFSGPLYLCLQPEIERWLEKEDPQVLIVEANPREPGNRRAAAWMRRRGRPVIGWGLGAPAGSGPLAPFRRLVRRAGLPRLDGAIAYSKRGKREFEALGLPAERVFVAPNAVRGRPAATGPLAPPAPAHDRPARLLFVGRLQSRKRVDLLLRACAELAAPVDLWIVGDGPAREALKGAAKRLLPQAQFLGHRTGLALERLFGEADLFVLPGTGGLALQEALAHGKPLIAAEGDGSQEDMVGPGNGWLVRPGDLQELVRTLREALEKREAWPRMGDASRRLARERFSLEAMVAAFLDALNAAVREAA